MRTLGCRIQGRALEADQLRGETRPQTRRTGRFLRVAPVFASTLRKQQWTCQDEASAPAGTGALRVQSSPNSELNASPSGIFIYFAKSEKAVLLKRSDRSSMVFDAGELTAAWSER